MKIIFIKTCEDLKKMIEEQMYDEFFVFKKEHRDSFVKNGFFVGYLDIVRSAKEPNILDYNGVSVFQDGLILGKEVFFT